MFTPWFDIEGVLGDNDALRRQMDALLQLARIPAQTHASNLGWADVREDAESWTLTADFPGLATSDITLTVQAGELRLVGERQPKVPDGYQVRRQERRGYKFDRSISLPRTVDTEHIGAEMTDGVLTIQMPRQPEARPRAISVNTSS